MVSSPDFVVVSTSSKGQIVLPKAFRDDIGISNKSLLACQKVGDKIILAKLETRTLQEQFDALGKSFRQSVKRKHGRLLTGKEILRMVRQVRDSSRP